MEVDRERAVDVASAAFQAHGIADEDARLTSRVLVSADARGKQSHGLLRLPRFVWGIEHGNVDPAGEIRIISDHRGAATIAGGARLGPVVASEAADETMDRAADFGIGCVGVHHTNHLGMLGYYTDVVRESGYVCLAMTNTEPAMPPHGGTEAVLGTNPIAIGLPTDPAFNLDMSTSAIARGDVVHRKERGEALPEDVALDESGQPTRDPEAALRGTFKPFGGPKGSGLAIAIEVLAGAFVGAATGSDVTGTYQTEDPCTKGDLFIVIDAVAMGAPEFAAEASAFLADLKRTEQAAGFEEIRLPGECSVKRDRRRTSVEIDENVWARVRDLAPSA